MSDFSPFTILYRIVCSGLLIVALVYAIKKYIKPLILESMKTYKLFYMSLQSDYRTVCKEHEASVKDTLEKELYAQKLFSKIALWQEQQNKKRESIVVRNENSKKYIKRYLDERVAWIVKDCAAKEVLPKAFTIAQKELEKKFSNQGAQQDFLKGVLVRVRKGVV
jgi:uncharacterized protein with von Willebrand factor type A (vWA) domain